MYVYVYISGGITHVNGKRAQKIILHNFEGIFLYKNELKEDIQWFKEETINTIRTDNLEKKETKKQLGMKAILEARKAVNIINKKNSEKT